MSAAPSPLTINTPEQLVTCETAAITWSGGDTPFFVSVFPGGTISNAYIQFPSVSASPLDWKVNLTAGTAVTIGVTDHVGSSNEAAPVTIIEGSDTSCVAASSGGSSSGLAPPGGSSSSSPSGSSSTSSPTASPKGSNSTSSGATSSSSSAGATNSGSAVNGGGHRSNTAAIAGGAAAGGAAALILLGFAFWYGFRRGRRTSSPDSDPTHRSSGRVQPVMAEVTAERPSRRGGDPQASSSALQLPSNDLRAVNAPPTATTGPASWYPTGQQHYAPAASTSSSLSAATGFLIAPMPQRPNDSRADPSVWDPRNPNSSGVGTSSGSPTPATSSDWHSTENLALGNRSHSSRSLILASTPGGQSAADLNRASPSNAEGRSTGAAAWTQPWMPSSPVRHRQPDGAGGGAVSPPLSLDPRVGYMTPPPAYEGAHRTRSFRK